jgi:protein ImuB
VQLHLDQLLGLRNLGLDFYQPPDRFETRLELNFDVESHQALLFRCGACSTTWRRSWPGATAACSASPASGARRGPDTVLKVGLLAAERDAAMLFELARGRLEPLRIPAPVRNLRLVAEDLPPFVPQHQALFDPRAQQAQPWEQLRERLRARLGDEAVKGCAPPITAPNAPGSWRSRAPKATCRLHQAAARAGCCRHRSRWMSRPGAGHAERIESGWWDGGDVRRDYYRIETRDGLRGWAYRDLSQAGPLWLQGWFA